MSLSVVSWLVLPICSPFACSGVSSDWVSPCINWPVVGLLPLFCAWDGFGGNSNMPLPVQMDDGNHVVSLLVQMVDGRLSPLAWLLILKLVFAGNKRCHFLCNFDDWKSSDVTSCTDEWWEIKYSCLTLRLKNGFGGKPQMSPPIQMDDGKSSDKTFRAGGWWEMKSSCLASSFKDGFGCLISLLQDVCLYCRETPDFFAFCLTLFMLVAQLCTLPLLSSDKVWASPFSMVKLAYS